MASQTELYAHLRLISLLISCPTFKWLTFMMLLLETRERQERDKRETRERQERDKRETREAERR